MADNLELNAGSGGATIATDDDTTAHHQYVKMEWGGDGVFTKVSSGASAVPIQDGGNTITVDGTVAVTGVATSAKQDTAQTTLTAIQTAVEILDNAIGGTEMQVDVLTLPNVTNAGTFAVQVSAAIPGTGATNLGKAEDAAHADGDTGVMMLGVRNDNGASTFSGTAGDYTPFAVDSQGRGFINTVALISNSVTPGVSPGHLGKAEDAAHASGDTGVFTLGVRTDAPAVSGGTDGDYVAIGVNANGGQWITPTPTTQGGVTISRLIDSDESEDEVKATAGQIYGWYLFNAAGSTRYVKYYNATAANTTVGTTTPILTIPVPAGGAANVEWSMGIPFSTALSVATTTGIADADTGAPAANDMVVMTFYK